MTTGEHSHCFCTQNTAGQPMCCICGVVLQSKIIDLETFLQWEQMGHKRDEIENDSKMKQGKLL